MIDLLSAHPATVFLIAANVILSFLTLANPTFMDNNIFHVEPIVEHREFHRLLTSGFLHGGGLHLLINMYVLWSFGAWLEGVLGPLRYLFVYVASLIGGSLWALMENRTKLQYRALGASGAVSGLVLSVCLLVPFAWLGVFFIPMPAVVFGVLFIVLSAVLAQRDHKIIGHEAHLGGALTGIVATILVAPGALSRFSEQIAAVLGGVDL
ncbi:MAG: rhomboid family intramembrane serine protease [Henriciella sp.]